MLSTAKQGKTGKKPAQTATHAIGGQFQRVYPVDGLTYIASQVLNFRPDGGAVTDTRQIVVTASCNECHARLEHHGGHAYRDTRLCILCHTTETTDASTRTAARMPPETIHFRAMIHKIHRGTNLENPYTVSGTDFTQIRFPGDLRDCAICHVDDTNLIPTPDGALTTVVTEGTTVISTKLPIRAACTACHDADDANAHTLAQTVNGVESCTVCHSEGAAFDVPIVHAIEP